MANAGSLGLATQGSQESHSSRAWGDLLRKHFIPETTVAAFAKEPLKATITHTFAYGLQTKEIFMKYLHYLLFKPGVGPSSSPDLQTTGTAGAERGITPQEYEFCHWTGQCHAL